ncbi:MAG: ABC transporter permease [Candidatus Aminicenantes bacterium]|nr:ABC transporter permease [Candidatus Aminicenantes bacterium]
MTFWNIALIDLKLTVKDKTFFLWLLVFPLLFAFIFGLAFPESSEGIQKVTLNILDRDNSFLSKALLSELEDEKYTTNILKSEEGKTIRTLIIPENFSSDIFEGKKVELILEKEADSNIEASQAAYSHILKGIIKILANLASLTPQSEKELEEKYDEQRLERLVTLRSERAGKLRSIPAGFNHMIPSTSVMFILFTILMYGGIILLQERREGQLERIYLSPASFSSIIAGKWLSRLFLGMLQLVILFSAGKILFKTYLGNSIPALFLVALFFCGTIAGMSILLGSIIRKEEVLIVLNILIANLMAGLGGCWMPRELFPPGLKTASFIFPTAWTMDAFDKLIFFGYDLKSVSLNILILFLFSLVFFFLAVKFIKLRKV